MKSRFDIPALFLAASTAFFSGAAAGNNLNLAAVVFIILLFLLAVIRGSVELIVEAIDRQKNK